MPMHMLDWMLVAVPLFLVLFFGWKAQSYVKGVADFLSAGRCAGRYLLSVADGAAGMGLISVIAIFEMQYRSGTALSFWSGVGTLVGLAMTLTGFVTYRYRETRAMTLAQFFEMRYSRRFRVFAGILASISGIINYALFPAIGGRFFLYYCGFPDSFALGPLQINTFGFIMAVALLFALAIVMTGGQLTTMVTDCLQGLFSYFAYAVMVVTILATFSFTQFREVMLSRPAGESFINPFDTGKLTDFNIFFVLIGVFGSIYARMAWQGNQAYNSCGASPHEQKMGGVLGVWRSGFQAVMIPLLVYGAYTFMHHADFAPQAAEVRAELVERINLETQVTTRTIREQMQVPLALRHLFPVGVTGIFCALMLFLMLSTDTTYLHSWGSIFVQDVVLPFCRGALPPGRHMNMLRWSIAGVAVFAWFFSFYFGQMTYILMFFAITGTIYLGGAGAVIIGGLYWRRGTSAGAWCAMFCGMFGGISSFILSKYWESPIYPWLHQHLPGPLETFGRLLEGVGAIVPIVNWKMSAVKFPVTGQEMYFLTMLLAIGAYVVVSLLTCRKPFDLDKMLHRGVYNLEHRPADDADPESGTPEVLGVPVLGKRRFKLNRLIGITPEYSRGDRILAWSVFVWTFYNFSVFLILVIFNTMIHRWSDQSWFLWWKYYTIGQSLLVGAVTTVWFSWGGVRDLCRLFVSLRSLERKTDASDNGQVRD